MTARKRDANGEFRVESLLNRTGEWLKGAGPEGDTVISTRVRLARNLARFPFLTVADAATRQEIEKYIRDKLKATSMSKKLHYIPLHEASPTDRQLLLERHLISREHAAAEGERGVAITDDETVAVMVNEEDHLRVQVIRSGFQPMEAFEELQRIDDALESQMTYAFHTKYGYVTCCPTNLGTGLRVSVMLHLPALVYTKQVEKILHSLQRVSYNIRGFFGEGTSPVADFFQVSNQVSLGRSEAEIVSEMREVVPNLLKVERGMREKLLREQRERLEDKILRALAVLKAARVLSSEEVLELLSTVRLGINLGIITNVPISLVNEVFILSQPGHMQAAYGVEMTSHERDVLRAAAIREKLKGV